MNILHGFKISRSKLSITLCISILLISTIFGSLKFLPFALILLYKEIFKNITSLVIFLLFSPLLLMTSFSNFTYYVVFILFIVLFSSRFYNMAKEVCHIYMNMMIPFLLILPFFPQYEGNTYSVLTFGDRLFPEIPLIDQSINPNTIAIIAATCSLLAILNKRYYLFSLVFFILLITQSRASIGFFFIVFIFCSNFNLNKIIGGITATGIFIYIISLTPIWERFNNYKENGRLETFALYSNIIEDSFPLGYPLKEYLLFSSKQPAGVDNLYLLGVINFGYLFVYICIFFIFYFILNKKDKSYKIRRAFFLGFFIFGLLEASFIGNYFLWPIFALCFNSFGRKNIKLI
ncbi:hypothetical protein G9F31_06290 [Acinetobacter sp. 187]|uniref:hypothetical protein n=1 Tax=Acinetobacter lanii TaxID=2715163 RepID=UPI00140969E2|nr:hypothetical protein [Acinetobacter lanii]NHC03376.1 hypothetical protein [Acinetobacter lanii]